MEDLFEKSFICPVCQSEFTSSIVRRSCIKVKKRHSDFYTEYEGDNPTFYGVICCKNCGYTVLESDFKIISEEQKFMIRRVIGSNWKSQDYTKRRSIHQAIQVHLIALANYKILKAKASKLGLVSLRIAWYHRALHEKDKEVKYLDDARLYFERAFKNEHSDLWPMEEIEMIYLIGDLNRQLGNHQAAIKWYNKVTVHEEKHKYRLIVNRARDYWAEIASIEREKRN